MSDPLPPLLICTAAAAKHIIIASQITPSESSGQNSPLKQRGPVITHTAVRSCLPPANDTFLSRHNSYQGNHGDHATVTRAWQTVPRRRCEHLRRVPPSHLRGSGRESNRKVGGTGDAATVHSANNASPCGGCLLGCTKAHCVPGAQRSAGSKSLARGPLRPLRQFGHLSRFSVWTSMTIHSSMPHGFSLTLMTLPLAICSLRSCAP
mmetsp:Transcript_13719/g.18546  ORF Transcript_13719/g.18546 Transcript_13719/m.18546 type:complete len:207 (+) Transcript_13719:66-686(+)